MRLFMTSNDRSLSEYLDCAQAGKGKRRHENGTIRMMKDDETANSEFNQSDT